MPEVRAFESHNSWSGNNSGGEEGQSLRSRRPTGLGAPDSARRFLQFFRKNYAILGIFD